MRLELDADGLPSGYFYPGDVDAYRNMASKVPNGGTIVEIGVYKGRSLCAIAPSCKARGIRMVAIDPWIGCDDMMELFLNHLRHFDVMDIVTVMRSMSHVAAQSFASGSVDLVFIDGPHEYEPVKRDILAWLPKVKSGGFLCGHDYCPEWPAVAYAVHEILGRSSYAMRVDQGVRCDCWCHRIAGGSVTLPSGQVVAFGSR
jgi:hypothetical protein